MWKTYFEILTVSIQCLGNAPTDFVIRCLCKYASFGLKLLGILDHVVYTFNLQSHIVHCTKEVRWEVQVQQVLCAAIPVAHKYETVCSVQSLVCGWVNRGASDPY